MTISPVRTVIVEDQPAIRKDIHTLVKKQSGFAVVGTCGSVREALTLISATSPDLLLLDISLPDGTGFDILKNISSIPVRVIFLTAYGEHAIKAIKIGVLDYLLKPLDEIELRMALDKVWQLQVIDSRQVSVAERESRETNVSNRLALRSQEFLQIVELDEIMYCHSVSGYTTFYLTDGRKVLTSKYIKEYEELLPAPSFLRPHQSYLVNQHFIDKYYKDYKTSYLRLKNGVEIPVSFRRREEIMDLLKGNR
jgi:two-component system LytT family response regulator